MCLQELHWLPIRYRIIFKLLTIVYSALQGQAPQYLKEKLKAFCKNQQTIYTMWHYSGHSCQQEKIILLTGALLCCGRIVE